MRTRYFLDSKGRPTIKASVYEKADHGISTADIDSDARNICTHLKSQGQEAYIVGGAIRDLLLGRIPKDFDIATDAPPKQVKRVFHNSRIIGKRFRLVHVYFPEGKIHEVATFRAPESGDRNHVFGSLDEDVMRRDFSLNALYYDPEEETVIDFVGGVKDIRNNIVKSVLPLASSFLEDPVRMLRAVKYAAITGMSIAPALGRRIRKQSALLGTASVSRLSEELFKILKSKKSEVILRQMNRYRLMSPMLPNFDSCFCRHGAILRETFFQNLGKMDQKMLEEDMDRGQMLQYLTEDLLTASGAFGENGTNQVQFPDLVLALKALLRPLVQPNRDVEKAVRLMFLGRGMKVPRHRSRYTISGKNESAEKHSSTGFHRGSGHLRHRRRPRSVVETSE